MIARTCAQCTRTADVVVAVYHCGREVERIPACHAHASAVRCGFDGTCSFVEWEIGAPTARMQLHAQLKNGVWYATVTRGGMVLARGEHANLREAWRIAGAAAGIVIEGLGQ